MPSPPSSAPGEPSSPPPSVPPSTVPLPVVSDIPGEPTLPLAEVPQPPPAISLEEPCAELSQAAADISPALQANLDKWDALHRTYGHACPNRMLKIAKGMLSEDPNRPLLNTLSKWRALCPCAPCVTGAMKRPAASKAHPPVPHKPDIGNGEGLHIDGMGAYPGLTHGGHTTTFLFTDDYSSVRVAFPTHTKSCEALLQRVQEYTAASQVALKFIRTDNEFLCEPLASWCRERNIHLSACAPHTHIQNPKAELSVGLVKDLSHKNKHMACSSDYLLAYNHVYTCQALNRQPTDSDPLGKMRSPLQIWPTAPFQHPAQAMAPWGCRTFGFVGKTTSAPNTGIRARPGINLGHAKDTSGIDVYHPDTDTIFTYGYAQYHAHVFPLKDMLLAGELAAQDGSIDPDGWRHPAILPVKDVADGPCAGFLSGKQIQFILPVEAEPDYPAPWQVRAHQPVYSPCGLTGLEVQFTKYRGSHSHFKKKSDRDFLVKPVLAILLMSPAAPHQAVPAAWYKVDVRSCLRETYPSCRTLADIPKNSVSLAGAYPQPRALADATKRQTAAATAQVPTTPSSSFPLGSIVVPVRKIASVRSPHATWMPVKHHMLPTRQRILVSATTTVRSPTRQSPTTLLALPVSQHLGFCPRSIKEARSHTSWPLWQSAIDKEITGLQNRHTWQELHESDLPPGIRVLDSKFVFADKQVTGPKVRVVVRGQAPCCRHLLPDAFSS